MKKTRDEFISFLSLQNTDARSCAIAIADAIEGGFLQTPRTIAGFPFAPTMSVATFDDMRKALDRSEQARAELVKTIEAKEAVIRALQGKVDQMKQVIGR